MGLLLVRVFRVLLCPKARQLADLSQAMSLCSLPSGPTTQLLSFVSINTMKISAAALVLAVAASVDAFSPAPLGVRSSVRLYSARPDTTEYVAAALEASKKYGATSKEARIAWEAVEEIDAADNR